MTELFYLKSDDLKYILWFKVVDMETLSKLAHYSILIIKYLHINSMYSLYAFFPPINFY